MTTKVSVIADSVNGVDGVRLTTLQLEYPRYIHAELMTYRVFSRNASSSRAVPIKTCMQRVLRNPVIPAKFGSNQKGMQAGPELTGWRLFAAKKLWLWSRYLTVLAAWAMDKCGLAKEVANRVLEPWSHIQVVVSSTDWDNMLAQRTDSMAQPDIQVLANLILKAMNDSTPKRLYLGDWHLPYVTEEELLSYAGSDEYQTVLPKVSAARCARVSYLLHDGKKSTVQDDVALFQRLVGGEIKHSSPLEHEAQVSFRPMMDDRFKSNFAGSWVQFRKLIPGENITNFKWLEKKNG